MCGTVGGIGLQMIYCDRWLFKFDTKNINARSDQSRQETMAQSAVNMGGGWLLKFKTQNNNVR